MTPELDAEYQQLKSGTGFVSIEDHGFLKLSGKDRRKFLHNFCTADINQLNEGHVTEAFVLDNKGRTLSFGHVISLPECLVFTFAGSANSSSLLEHFDKYIIMDDVTIDDMSQIWSSCFFSDNAEIEGLDSSLAFNQAKIVNSLNFAKIELAGNGWLVFGAKEELEQKTGQWLQKSRPGIY